MTCRMIIHSPTCRGTILITECSDLVSLGIEIIFDEAKETDMVTVHCGL